jgi:hypothetical protein
MSDVSSASSSPAPAPSPPAGSSSTTGSPASDGASSAGGVGSGAVGSGAVGNGAVGNGAVGNGAVGNGAVGNGAVGSDAVGSGAAAGASLGGPTAGETIAASPTTAESIASSPTASDRLAQADPSSTTDAAVDAAAPPVPAAAPQILEKPPNVCTAPLDRAEKEWADKGIWGRFVAPPSQQDGWGRSMDVLRAESFKRDCEALPDRIPASALDDRQAKLNDYAAGKVSMDPKDAVQLRSDVKLLQDTYRPGPKWEAGATPAEKAWVAENNLRATNTLTMSVLGVFGVPAAVTRWAGGSEQQVAAANDFGAIAFDVVTAGATKGSRNGTSLPDPVRSAIHGDPVTTAGKPASASKFDSTPGVEVTGARAIDMGQTYEAGVRQQYGNVPFSQRTYTAIVDGKVVNGVADNVAVIGDKNTAVEAKFVGDWSTSLRNPNATGGDRPWARAEQAQMIEQAKKYDAAFDQVIYHTNSPELAAHYAKAFKDAGIDNFRFVITPATR